MVEPSSGAYCSSCIQEMRYTRGDMASLPLISGRECIQALARIGYREIRQRGSHVRLACPGRTPVTVPLHPTLDRGTLRSIIRTAELTVEDFCGLLD